MIILLDTQSNTILQRWSETPLGVQIPGTLSTHTRVSVPEYLPDGLDRYYLTTATVNLADPDPETEKLGPEVVTVNGLDVTISRAAVPLTVPERRNLINAELAETDRAMARVAEDGISALDMLIDDLEAAGVLTNQQASASKAKIPASVRQKINQRIAWRRVLPQ